MTAGQRWRFRRNLVIWVAHRRGGVSQRVLADVFDLARSRVKAILDEFDGLAERRESCGGDDDGWCGRPRLSRPRRVRKAAGPG